MKRISNHYLNLKNLAWMGIAIFLTACDLDDANDGLNPEDLAYVSFYHASPDTEGVDILVGASKLNQTGPLEFEEYISYSYFYPGDREIKITEGGNAGNVAIDTTLTFKNLTYYTVFIADSLSSIEAIALKDSTETPGEGKVMIRFIHLSPDAPELNVFLDDEPLFEGISFKENTSFTRIDAGVATLQFETTDETETVLLSVPNLEIKTGRVYTLVLNGFMTPAEGTHELSTDFISH